MTCPACPALRWLVRDTFLQARASGIGPIMLAGSALCAALCLTVRAVEGDSGAGHLDVAFGCLQIPFSHGVASGVHTLESQLAGWVADAAGTLLALLWTASFLPSFLDPAAVTVLLAKPVARWRLLAGKFLGVLAFLAFQAVVFVAGTSLALALRTGVCQPAYFLCVPLLLLHFAVFFSFSAMLAVCTRSTVACVFGSVLFWMLCWAVNFGRHAALTVPEFRDLSPLFAHTIELGYWLLPKPLDFHLFLAQTLGAESLASGLIDPRLLTLPASWSAAASLTTSALCAAALFGLTAYDFQTADY